MTLTVAFSNRVSVLCSCLYMCVHACVCVCVFICLRLCVQMNNCPCLCMWSTMVCPCMCGADCWTDHRLVVSKLNLRIQPARRPQDKKAPKRLDVSKLNHDSMRQAFINDISNQLGAMNFSSEDPEENWTVFQKVVHSSAATNIGHPSRKHQDWFDENDKEIKLLLEEKHCLHKAHQDDTSSVSRRLPTTIFVRQSKTGSVTCKTPG